jgi:hypothetical protein
MMAFVGTLIVSTKTDRGHIGSNTPSQSAANKASAANDPGATDDRGRDVTAGSLGVESGETTRREREPGVFATFTGTRRVSVLLPSCPSRYIGSRCLVSILGFDFRAEVYIHSIADEER